MIKYSAQPSVDLTVTLSDGTVLKRTSIDSVVTHVDNRIKSCKNQIEHYAKEMIRLKTEMSMLEADQNELAVISSSEGMDKSDV